MENEMQRLVALTPAGQQITPEALSLNVARPPQLSLVSTGKQTTTKRTLSERLEEVERAILQEALTQHKGNLSRVAAELGVSRNGLRKMLTRLQLTRQRS